MAWDGPPTPQPKPMSNRRWASTVLSLVAAAVILAVVAGWWAAVFLLQR